MASLEEAGPQDYEALAAFLAAFPETTGSREFWLSRFARWWEENPAFQEGWTRGWLLREGPAIVGFLGNVPSRFQLSGNTVTAFNATTWMVLPKHREDSMSLLFRQLAAAKSSVLVDATPTTPVIGLLEALRFSPLPSGPARETVVPVWPWRRPHRAGADLRRLSAAGLEFDALWENTKSVYENTAVRAAADVAWRILGDDFIPKALIGLYRSGRLAGYAAFKERRRRGLKTWDCVDLWPTWSPEDISALVAFAAGAAPGCALLTFPGFCGVRGLLTLSRPSRAYFKADAATTGVLLSGRSYFGALEGDAPFAP